MYVQKSSFASMKKVLSLLVAFVFLQVQSWALSGGPVFAGSQASVKGTYAGSMVTSLGGNSLGIFAMGVPATGLASGIFAMFVNGGGFYGSIVGIIDPDKLTLNALAQAQENEQIINTVNGQVQIITIPVAIAAGVIKCVLKGDANSGTNGSGGFRLIGTGTLQTSVFDNLGNPVPGAPIDVTVDGFQQSTTVDQTINLNLLTGTQGTSSGS
jgi:hypothetical protein